MSGILCEHCTGVCCRYIALPIEKPESRADFDDIRWYLLHTGISVFVEDGEWYINMATPCRHLGADNRCRIYHTRPSICRKYTAENCDYHSGDYGWEQHFACPEHLDEYAMAALRRTGPTDKESQNNRSNNKYVNVTKSSVFSHSLKNNNHMNSKNCRKSRNSKSKPPGPRSRLRPAPEKCDVAAASSDIAGVPLPALENEP